MAACVLAVAVAAVALVTDLHKDPERDPSVSTHIVLLAAAGQRYSPEMASRHIHSARSYPWSAALIHQ